MRIYKISFFLFCFFGAYLCSYAQALVEVYVSEEAELDEMSFNNIEEIRKEIQKQLYVYSEAARLFDTISNEVTAEKIAQFRSLFQSSSVMLAQDYQLRNSDPLISQKKYADDVYKRLKNSGVKFDLIEAKIINSKNSGTGYYDTEVEIVKVMYNYFDISKNKEVSVADGRSINQIITYTMNDDVKNAKILNIKQVVLPTTDFVPILDLYAGFGISRLNVETSSYFEDKSGSTDVEILGGLDYSFGVEVFYDNIFNKSGASRNNIDWSIGLNYSNYSFNTILDWNDSNSYLNEAVLDTSTIIYYNRIVELHMEEKLKINVFSIPIGVRWSILKADKFHFNLHTRLIPSFPLVGNGESTESYDEKCGGFFHSETGEILDFDFCNPNSINQDDQNTQEAFGNFDFGTTKNNDEIQAGLENMYLSMQFSPTAYFKLSDNPKGWGLLAGLDLTYNFGTMFIHEPFNSFDEEFENNKYTYNRSLLNSYTDDLSRFNIGFRVGLFYYLTDNF